MVEIYQRLSRMGRIMTVKRLYLDGECRRMLKLPAIVVNKYHSNRPGVSIMRGTPWGNPYKIGIDGDRDEVLRKFCKRLLRNPLLIEKAVKVLSHQVLICCCKPQDCHGDIWARLVNGDCWLSIWNDYI